MWKLVRITALLLALVVVAGMTYIDRVRTTRWKDPIWVGIFPMNADGSTVTERYVQSLQVEDFVPIERFFAEQASRYGVTLAQPARIELYPSPAERPPILERGAGPIATAWWSLKMRWYAHRAADVPGRAPAHIRVFVLFHDPAVSDSVPHSLGLQKGLVGVVHAFADREMQGQNNIVIAHETLHTVGATDKYDLGTDEPIYPDGYIDPHRTPRFPQPQAEIMAGKRPLSATDLEMPQDLRGAAVGRRTALEIGWLRP